MGNKMNEIKGNYQVEELQIAIVASSFNKEVTKNLLEGALAAFRKNKMPEDQITVVWVPGAFELIFTAKLLAESCNYDAILCLGAVIKGDTDHYDHVAREVASGIAKINLETATPTLFGVLTTQTEELAIARSTGFGPSNKGYEAALATLEMANLSVQLYSDEFEQFMDEDDEAFEEMFDMACEDSEK
jgi:6,7-dimethyl-8-ribityllumazine synthase